MSRSRRLLSFVRCSGGSCVNQLVVVVQDPLKLIGYVGAAESTRKVNVMRELSSKTSEFLSTSFSKNSSINSSRMLKMRTFNGPDLVGSSRFYFSPDSVLSHAQEG